MCLLVQCLNTYNAFNLLLTANYTTFGAISWIWQIDAMTTAHQHTKNVCSIPFLWSIWHFPFYNITLEYSEKRIVWSKWHFASFTKFVFYVRWWKFVEQKLVSICVEKLCIKRYSIAIKWRIKMKFIWFFFIFVE